MDGNPSELMTRPGGQSALAFDGNWLRSARATLDLHAGGATQVYERMLASAWQACRDADALIIGLPTIWGAHIAEARRIPCVGGLLQPLSRTRAFPSALLPSTHSRSAQPTTGSRI